MLYNKKRKEVGAKVSGETNASIGMAGLLWRIMYEFASTISSASYAKLVHKSVFMKRRGTHVCGIRKIDQRAKRSVWLFPEPVVNRNLSVVFGVDGVEWIGRKEA
jgi:hypothetical protein